MTKKKSKRSVQEENIDAMLGVSDARYRNKDGTYAKDPFKRMADITGVHFDKKKKKKRSGNVF